ncbi:cytochrome P450 [Daedaleopsis nitida]|nr:cytochrome P450 [Daedaleopsis nitida]
MAQPIATFTSGNIDLLSPALLLSFVIILVSIFARLVRVRQPIERLPAPPNAEYIWGHERSIYLDEPGRLFREWTRVLGLVYRIKAAFGANDVLVLSDPVAISYILQKKIYDYHHSGVVRPRVARLLGKGLGWVEGEFEHKRMRHLVSPSLSAENVKAMSLDIRVAACKVVDDFENFVQLRDSASMVNIAEWTAKATLNVVGRVAFLHDFEGGASAEAKEILHARRRGVSPAAKYIGLLTLMLLRRFPVLNDLPIEAIQSQGLAKLAIQSGVAHELVRRNQGVVDEKNGKDLLSRLLVAHASGKITREELYEQISTFIISGHETTTQTLAFTIYELSRNASIQERLRAEVKTFSLEPTYDEYQTQLPYLDAVLKETLRMYPGLPYMERVATKPDSIPLRDMVTLDGGEAVSSIHIAPGQVILIPIMAIHRMSHVWKDADVFRPERWLEELPATAQLCSGWSNLLAFSDGPRNCIGMRLAIFQYKVILSYLLQRFRFEDAGMDITLKIASSLQAWVIGRPELGACLPVNVELL